MIFITGDTHGDIDSDVLYTIANDYPDLNKNDYVIVAGDFGGCWNRKQLEKTKQMMSELPFTLLFVDGNHENFTILNSYKIEEWKGGKVHKLFDDCIHLIRGEIFRIDNKVILALGGAESIDKQYRRKNISYWEEESITDNDLNNAFKHLKLIHNKVDIVISHTVPSSMLYEQPFYDMTRGIPKSSELRLQNIYYIIDYKDWYFGHWHLDIELKNNFHALYKTYKLIDF